MRDRQAIKRAKDKGRERGGALNTLHDASDLKQKGKGKERQRGCDGESVNKPKGVSSMMDLRRSAA